jgi:hypothetical protein
VAGELVQLPEERRAIVMLTEDDRGGEQLLRIDRASIEEAAPPGGAGIWTGSILLAHGWAGMATTIFIGRPTGDPDLDDLGCEGCVMGAAIGGSLMALGTMHLLGGLAYRLRALRRLRQDPRPVGRAHRIGGGVMLALGVAAMGAAGPMLFSNDDTMEVLAVSALSVAPGIALIGLVLMARGARLKRRHRDWPAFGPEGLVFDLSL